MKLIKNWKAFAGSFAVVVTLAGGLSLSPPAEAAPASTTSAQASYTGTVTLASTIALSNCSASLVRFPTSVSTDRALMLTNGHCYEGGMPGPGVVVTNKRSSRSGTLLDAAGNRLGSVRAKTMLYATMTGTDITLYELSDTFANIKSKYGADPMTIAGSRPADGTAMGIPSSYWKQIWSCQVNGFTDLLEGGWSFTDSIRYNDGCSTIHGTSGSPIVRESDGQVIGINNTGNDNGEMCTLNNPCEVNADGTTSAYQGRSYGQQTWWITTCVNANRKLDLTVSGCMLAGAA